ncbi:MAG: hypothetical protein F6K24_08950 [Okeania sp. SIO2D1]|uniref:hypothetical protein n=1 Tax=Okeania sp. SIO2C9 TaxID=2607791 RepID=UPI0013B7E3F2|nr:hypothetical protein [Okeania sp. SIO2C9]NEQ76472.1 hypothetical protein [Okeania sp. SIO2C9]NES65369.1 hypothetical protein [Okeania sp. SIO2D1]
MININQQLVENYRQPVENSYQYKQQFDRGQNLTIQAFEDINLSVDEILGG